jgi:hypothetical protein
MTTSSAKKLKPLHIALIVGAWIVFGLFYLYKDKILPNPNEAYKTEYATYIKTNAVIVSQKGNGRTGRKAATLWTLQFRDQNGELKTREEQQWTLLGKEKGDSVTIYYNPQNPSQIVSEDRYKEITK